MIVVRCPKSPKEGLKTQNGRFA